MVALLIICTRVFFLQLHHKTSSFYGILYIIMVIFLFFMHLSVNVSYSTISFLAYQLPLTSKIVHDKTVCFGGLLLFGMTDLLVQQSILTTNISFQLITFR